MSLCLLAQKSRMDELARQMGGGFRGEPTAVNWSGLLIGMAAVTAVLLVWWMAARWLPESSRRPVGGPWRLFFALCGAHGLEWTDRWLVWRLARRQRLDHPARLFVEPERWAPANLGWLGPSRAERLAHVRERLFGGLPEDAG